MKTYFTKINILAIMLFLLSNNSFAQGDTTMHIIGNDTINGLKTYKAEQEYNKHYSLTKATVPDILKKVFPDVEFMYESDNTKFSNYRRLIGRYNNNSFGPASFNKLFDVAGNKKLSVNEKIEALMVMRYYSELIQYTKDNFLVSISKTEQKIKSFPVNYIA